MKAHQSGSPAKLPDRAELPGPGEGRPVIAAGSEAIIHTLDAVCKRLDRIIELEKRIQALERAGGKR